MGPLLSAPVGASKRETPTSNLTESTVTCSFIKSVVSVVNNTSFSGANGYKSKILNSARKINNFDMKHYNVVIYVIPLIDFNMSVYIFVPSTDT